MTHRVRGGSMGAGGGRPRHRGSSSSSSTKPAVSKHSGSQSGSVPDSDEGDESGDMDGAYSTVNFDGQKRECLHCGDDFVWKVPYHGYYCEDCRPPNGFLSEE